MNITTRLRTWRDRVATEPGLKRNVGAYVALLVLAIGAGGWILTNQQFTPPWSDDIELTAEFEALPGIAPGNGQEVRVAGVIAGSITGASVNDKGRAVLTMRVDKDVEIHEDATLVLRPKSPLNEMYVTIAPGTKAAPRVSDDHQFALASTRRPIQVDEILGSLDDDARGALTALLTEADDALASAPESLAASLDQAGTTLSTLQPVVAELDQRRESLRRLVAALGAIAGAVGGDDERLTTLAASLQSTLAVVGDQSGDLSASLDRLPGLIDKLNGSTAAVTDLSAVLDPTLRDVQSAADTLPRALEKLEDVSDPLQRTIDLAAPVVRSAVPLVADLRPFTEDLRDGLPILQRSTARLDPMLDVLLDYRDDVAAFMVNTRSLTSMRDGNGGILRGMLQVNTTSLPTDLLTVLTPELEGPLG